MPGRSAKNSVKLPATIPLDGTVALPDHRYERYCHARAEMKSKLEAYREAGFESKSDHTARGNASKLEREVPAIAARIAYLCRTEQEPILQEKRRRLEERLWLVHDANVAQAFETIEVERCDRQGKVMVSRDGKPLMKTITRPKHISQLSEDLQRCI
jgi:hypothetical protein